MVNRDNSGRVIKHSPQEGIAARAHAVTHGTVRKGRSGIDRTQYEIITLLRRIPPGEPCGPEGLTLSNKTPLFRGGLALEIADQIGPDLVALDVSDVKVV